MPFTFAHPMFAAPLKVLKPKYISLTGLILGSMAPDFEYFIALEPYQSIGHSTAGLWLYAIPLSILLAVVFHYIIKIPLIDNLPTAFGIDRKARGLNRDWKMNRIRSWIIFIICVIIGFYSHVLLDAFTHKSGWFVTQYSYLQVNLIGYPVYKWLQHGLSIVGLLLEAAILIVLSSKTHLNKSDAGGKSNAKIRYWSVVLLVTVLTVVFKLLFTSSANYIGILIVSPLSGLF